MSSIKESEQLSMDLEIMNEALQETSEKTAEAEDQMSKLLHAAKVLGTAIKETSEAASGFGQNAVNAVKTFASNYETAMKLAADKTGELVKKHEESGKSLGFFDTKMGKGIATATNWGLAIADAAVGAGKAIFKAGSEFADAAAEIEKLSSSAKTDAETWQKLSYAMEKSGVDVASLGKTMAANNESLKEAGKGVSSYAKAYEELGVNIENTDGTLKNADEVYQETLQSLADMEDLSQRNALANQLFGESYENLAPMLDAGAASFEGLKARAEELGLVMSNDSVEAGAKFNSTLEDIKVVGETLKDTLAIGFMPVLQSIMDFFIEKAPEIQVAVGKVANFIQNAVESFQLFWDEHGEAISSAVSVVFETICSVIGVAMDIVTGIIKTFITLMTIDWAKIWENVQNAVSDAWTSIKTAVSNGVNTVLGIVTDLGSKLFQAGKEIFGRLKDGITETWESIESWVSDKVSWLKDKLTFWKKASEDMDSGNIDGSHASGLPFVPYDGYVAKLHRGERVVNAEENKSFGREAEMAAGNTFIFNAPNPLTPAEARRQMQKAWKELALGF